MTQICQVVKPTAQKLQNTKMFKDNELQTWDMTESSHNNGGGQRTPKWYHNKFNWIKLVQILHVEGTNLYL